MAKLRGKAKQAFLDRMAAGRRRARRSGAGARARAPARTSSSANPRPRILKRDVTRAAADLQWKMAEYGPNNMATQRAEILYADLAADWAGQKAKRRCKPCKPGRRRNPDLVTVSGMANPAPRELAKAVAAYRQFHGVDPTRVTKGTGGPVLISLGELREIVYQPKRGNRKGPAFFHKFKPGNVLAVTADGKRLVIVDRSKRKAVDFDLGIVN